MLWEAPDRLETSLAPSPHSGSWRETWCLHPLLTPTPPSLPALTLYSSFLRVLITGILSSSLRCCWCHGIWNSRAGVIQVGTGGESCKPVVMDGTAWGKQRSPALAPSSRSWEWKVCRWRSDGVLCSVGEGEMRAGTGSGVQEQPKGDHRGGKEVQVGWPCSWEGRASALRLSKQMLWLFRGIAACPWTRGPAPSNAVNPTSLRVLSHLLNPNKLLVSCCLVGGLVMCGGVFPHLPGNGCCYLPLIPLLLFGKVLQLRTALLASSCHS